MALPLIDAQMQDDVIQWRRDLHANPELLYEVHRTAGFVAAKLEEFGCDEIVTGIGKTGVVGVINGKSNTTGRVIGLRADMDALPIEEATGLPYASRNPGKMHACGHDGHTAMLLGASRQLAQTRSFNGKAIVIFQPAEEGGGGGKALSAFIEAVENHHPDTVEINRPMEGIGIVNRFGRVLVSDKGRDLLGVLQLFRSLPEALLFLNNS